MQNCVIQTVNSYHFSQAKKSIAIRCRKNRPVEREFDGKKVMKFQYTVKELNTDQEKIWPVSKTTSEQIDAFLSECHTLLRIQRVGSGRDTRYQFLTA